MSIEKIKKYNDIYDKNNLYLIEIEKEIEPYETILNSNGIAYEIESKDEMEKKIKNILVKIKKFNKNVKQFERDVFSELEIKTIIYPKVKVLLHKYTGILKRILVINDRFGFLGSYTIKSTNNEEITVNIDSSEQKQSQKFTQVGNQNVISAYNNSLERNTEINKLTRDIRELYDMFQDFAILVEGQHEQILSIENHVEVAQTRVEKGNNNLRQAIEHQKKTRKKYCCFVLVIVIILIIIFSVLGRLSFT